MTFVLLCFVDSFQQPSSSENEELGSCKQIAFFSVASATIHHQLTGMLIESSRRAGQQLLRLVRLLLPHQQESCLGHEQTPSLEYDFPKIQSPGGGMACWPHVQSIFLLEIYTGDLLT